MSPSKRPVLLLAMLMAMLALAIELTTRQLIRPWTVAGPSMAPTLTEGNRVLVDLWTYRHRRPIPGEILLVRGPNPGGALLVKRCVRPPTSDAAKPRAGVWPTTRSEREPGIWVLGDNSTQSWDSRRFGAVPRSLIVGRVVFRYWPVDARGTIR